MAGDIKNKYGTADQPLTITLASLGNSATVGRESTVVDNTTNLFCDALLFVRAFAGGTAANDKALYIYGYGTADGSTYTEGCTGSDAAFTRRDPTTLRLIGVIPMPTISVQYNAGPFSVAAAFGGVLPSKWGIVVFNFAGAALTSDAGNNEAFYQGVLAQYT